jgi:hypothetical protein
MSGVASVFGVGGRRGRKHRRADGWFNVRLFENLYASIGELAPVDYSRRQLKRQRRQERCRMVAHLTGAPRAPNRGVEYARKIGEAWRGFCPEATALLGEALAVKDRRHLVAHGFPIHAGLTDALSSYRKFARRR